MLRIALANDRTAFKPGEQIAGIVRWQCESAPERIEITLGWATSGKGTTDWETVATDSIPSPPAHGEHAFRFTAPREPYSFSGKLISLTWSVEAVAEPGDDANEVQVVIAPDGREIVLPTAAPSLPEN
jgi:hypothetical protein